MITVSLNLQAGQYLKVGFQGEFFQLLASSSPMDIDFIRDGSPYSVAKQMEFGFWRRSSQGFTELGFTSASAQTIKFMYGVGEAGYNRTTGSVQIIGQQGTPVQSAVNVTNANQQILPANAARRYLMIQNNSAIAALRVKFDGNPATATAGLRIQPGGSEEMPWYLTNTAINAILEAADATANNIEIIEG